MSTSLQAPAGATAPNAWTQSQTLLCVPAPSTGTGELPGLSPGFTCPNILGKPGWSPRVSTSLWGHKGGGTGQGEVVARLPTRLQHWGAEVSFPASPTNLPPVLVLQMRCPYHIYFYNLFYVIGIIFCSKRLPTIRPTVQNWRSD